MRRVVTLVLLITCTVLGKTHRVGDVDSPVPYLPQLYVHKYVSHGKNSWEFCKTNMVIDSF